MSRVDGFPEYESLRLEWAAERVLRITMDRGKMNAMDYTLHHDITEIWKLVDAHPDVSVAVVTGANQAFSAGGDFEMEKQLMEDFQLRCLLWKDGRNLVHNILNCNKPIISAINGAAAGGGLVVALLADVSIMAKSAKLVDGHTRLGVAAGDHAAIIWPLLCGMAKAKYYLMTCDAIYGEEADRIGLVSMCVKDAELQDKAVEVAERLAAGAPSAIRWTKYAMNNWMRMMWPVFDASMALEMMGFSGPEVREGVAAHQEKRPPNFDPRSPV